MIPAAFEYQRSATLDDALQALAGGGGSVKLLAGGQSLLPLLKLRLGAADKLLDIGRLTELKGVTRRPDGRVSIGAMTTYSELLDSPAESYGLFGDALPGIGDVQVRNRGTIGGAIAHADPASDMPACLLALDAEIVARSVKGERTIPIDGFFLGPFTTALGDDELITEVILPGPRDDAGSAYLCLEQAASGYALVGVAAIVFMAKDDSIAGASVAITGVGEHVYRARGVESALAGSDRSAGSIAAAAAHATDGIEVMSDIHAGRAYRTAMAATYTQRAIEAALARLA